MEKYWTAGQEVILDTAEEMAIAYAIEKRQIQAVKIPDDVKETHLYRLKTEHPEFVNVFTGLTSPKFKEEISSSKRGKPLFDLIEAKTKHTAAVSARMMVDANDAATVAMADTKIADALAAKDAAQKAFNGAPA